MEYDLLPNRRFGFQSHFFAASSGESTPTRLNIVLSMKRIPFGLQAFIALLLFIGCSQPASPSKDELVEDYNKSLNSGRTYYRISKFDIEEQENLGTNTEPEFRSIFKATVKYDISSMSDTMKKLFEKLDLDNKDILEIHGIATSRRSRGDWDTTFKVETEKQLQAFPQ
ncbi:hypothetical protein ACSYAD_20715 [Acaryochloris marina NIES-2412]|uniref:hypothetical protein n=1 Tax=Acaryochloris marina TaxID=155978 RepID=UPI004058720C